MIDDERKRNVKITRKICKLINWLIDYNFIKTHVIE